MDGPSALNIGSLVAGMSAGGIAGNLLFSSVGFVAFAYGKKTMRYQVMGMGGVLMVFPYFVENTLLLWLVGMCLTGAMFFLHD